MRRGAIVLFIVAVCIGISGKWLPKGPSDIQIVKLKVTSAYGDTWEGTGFFVADDLILTAGHMVEDANFIQVIYPDGKRIEVLDWYLEDVQQTDVGIVRVRTAKRERQIRFVDAKVGDKVIAIGDPYGYWPVTTFGHISAINVDDDWWGNKNVLMADVALNPGNSGCPLIHGRAVCAMCIGGIFPGNNVTFCVPAKVLRLTLNKYWATTALKECE